jgi:hypothetical protein
MQKINFLFTLNKNINIMVFLIASYYNYQTIVNALVQANAS